MNNPTLTALAAALVACLSVPAQAAPPLPVTGLDTASTAYQTANAWIEIDQVAFEHNLRTLQALLDGKSQICAIMKADAYGHGIANLMPSVIAAGIPCVGITSNEEARVVRASGYKGRIMRVRSATVVEVRDGFQYDMEELFGDVEALGDEGDFLLHALGIGRLAERFERFEELAALGLDGFGRKRAGAFDELGDGLGPFADGGGERLALAGAVREEFGERRFEQLEQAPLRFLGIELGFAHHAGPAQDLAHREGGRFGQMPVDFGLGEGERLQGDGVERERRLHGRALHFEPAFDLAAGERLLQAFTQQRLEGAPVLGQAEIEVEEASVDAAQFEAQEPSADLGLRAGKPCHTVYH